MTGAKLYALYQALDAKARRVAFAWTLYGQPAIPDTHQENCWAAIAEFRGAVAASSAEAINDFLALTGSKSRIAA
jgi:hypothetical protein